MPLAIAALLLLAAGPPSFTSRSSAPIARGITPSWPLLADAPVQRELRLAPGIVQQVVAIIKAAEAAVTQRLTRPGAAARAITKRRGALEIAGPRLHSVGEGMTAEQRLRLVKITI